MRPAPRAELRHRRAQLVGGDVQRALRERYVDAGAAQVGLDAIVQVALQQRLAGRVVAPYQHVEVKRIVAEAHKAHLGAGIGEHPRVGPHGVEHAPRTASMSEP